MDVDIVQANAEGSIATYEFRQLEERVGSARILETEPLAVSCQLAFLDQSITICRKDVEVDKRQKSLLWHLLFPEPVQQTENFIILREGRNVGCIYNSRSQKLQHTNTLAHCIMEYNCFCYSLYRVGRGREGINFPVYEGDMQIGLIKKPHSVRKQKSLYHIVAVDKAALLVSSLFALHEIAFSVDQQPDIIPSIYIDSVITTDKSLITKDDPKFEESVADTQASGSMKLQADARGNAKMVEG